MRDAMIFAMVRMPIGKARSGRFNDMPAQARGHGVCGGAVRRGDVLLATAMMTSQPSGGGQLRLLGISLDRAEGAILRTTRSDLGGVRPAFKVGQH